MKTTLALLIASAVLAAGLFIAVAAEASDSSSCYAVSDADARVYCLAKANKQPSTCYSIQRAELRSLCLAEVKK